MADAGLRQQGCVWSLCRGSHYPVPKLFSLKKKKKKIGSLSSLEITLRGVEEGARGDCSLHALKQHLKCKSSSIDPHPPYHTPITICPQVICLQNEQCLKCCAPAVFTQELFFEPNLIHLVRNFNCVDK